MRHKLLMFIGILIFLIASINISISYNYEYVNVTSKVNITNAYPEIQSISLSQNILLNAGGNKTVWCNVTVLDWNGWDDINLTNATLWDANNASFGDADNVINHYTNSSCTLEGNDGNYTANYTCAFSVVYYANPSVNWTCNVTVMDDYNYTDWGINITTIQTYYALNVTSPIDFGQMAVGDTKGNITANITNFGNADINISVEGYGVTPNDGLAMKCQVRNITIANLKYAFNSTAARTDLTGSPVNISGLTVPRRTVGLTWNATYWDLYIPPSENPYGVCNGTVVFTAQIG